MQIGSRGWEPAGEKRGAKSLVINTPVDSAEGLDAHFRWIDSFISPAVNHQVAFTKAILESHRGRRGRVDEGWVHAAASCVNCAGNGSHDYHRFFVKSLRCSYRFRTSMTVVD